MTDINDAIILAAKTHRGQTDKAGDNYILHPLRLMMQCESDIEMMTAVLHDVVEDSDLIIDDLREKGFPAEVVEAVDNLSRRNKESYEKFIERCRQNPLARKIKILDLEDNLNLARLKKWTFGSGIRCKMYLEAYNSLKEAGEWI